MGVFRPTSHRDFLPWMVSTECGRNGGFRPASHRDFLAWMVSTECAKLATIHCIGSNLENWEDLNYLLSVHHPVCLFDTPSQHNGQPQCGYNQLAVLFPKDLLVP